MRPPANQMAGQQPQAGSMEDVVASLSERLRHDPDNHADWFLLGLAYRETGRFAEAAQAFRRAMELAPQNADYTLSRRDLLLMGGGDAAARGRAAVPPRARAAAGNPAARYYLADAQGPGGDHRGAARRFDRAAARGAGRRAVGSRRSARP